MNSVDLQNFYKKIIKEWIMGDLHAMENKGANLITALGCLVFTEAIGLYLPKLDKNIEKHICNDKQKCFYRCLFALKSERYLVKCDKKIKKITKGNGLYQLRNKIAHRYLPNLTTPSLIPVGVCGLHNKLRPPFPIFIKEKGGKIEKIVINNVKYIEELQKLVDDVYNKAFVKKEAIFVNAIRSGYNKLFKSD